MKTNYYGALCALILMLVTVVACQKDSNITNTYTDNNSAIEAVNLSQLPQGVELNKVYFKEADGKFLLAETESHNATPTAPFAPQLCDGLPNCNSEIYALQYSRAYKNALGVANLTCKPATFCLGCCNEGVSTYYMYKISPTNKRCSLLN